MEKYDQNLAKIDDEFNLDEDAQGDRKESMEFEGRMTDLIEGQDKPKVINEKKVQQP